MSPLHRIHFPEELEVRLTQEAVKRGLESVDALIPVIVEEYFRMWDDLESGAALLRANETECD